MLCTIEKALKELARFRKRDEIDTDNAVAIADLLEELIEEIASGDPEVADMLDRFREECYST